MAMGLLGPVGIYGPRARSFVCPLPQIVCMIDSFLFKQNKTRKFFTTRVLLFFTSQNVIIINPEISKTQVHKCTSNHGGG